MVSVLVHDAPYLCLVLWDDSFGLHLAMYRCPSPFSVLDWMIALCVSSDSRNQSLNGATAGHPRVEVALGADCKLAHVDLEE